jgi:hypothetical protein
MGDAKLLPKSDPKAAAVELSCVKLDYPGESWQRVAIERGCTGILREAQFRQERDAAQGRLRELFQENARLRSFLASFRGANGCWCDAPPKALPGEHSMKCRAIRSTLEGR